jgi:hypothetical protein
VLAVAIALSLLKIKINSISRLRRHREERDKVKRKQLHLKHSRKGSRDLEESSDEEEAAIEWYMKHARQESDDNLS